MNQEVIQPKKAGETPTPEQAMFLTVQSICNGLTKNELVALNITIQFGVSPIGRLFDFEKVKALFNTDMTVHGIIKDYVSQITNRRLQQKEDEAITPANLQGNGG